MELTVLSLFDGISCGQQALERVGKKVKAYYASEIDKYAITATMANYPNTIQLGSVVDVDVNKLPKIDLLIGGSPCQSFSFAGKRKGMSTKDNVEILTLDHYLQLKAEGYEFEGQSYLFWEYMRVLEDLRKTNPDIKFLLENVMMGEKWQRVLTRAIGINPIEINAALVSAQNRRRLFWTNIGAEADGLFGDLVCKIEQPKDKGILLRDVLESEVDEKYYLSDKMISCMVNHTQRMKDKGNGFEFNPTDGDVKGKSLTTRNGSRPDDNYIVHNMMPRSGDPKKGGTGHLTRTDGKTYCLDTGNTNAVEIVAMRGRGEKGDVEQKLEYNGTNKSNSLTTVQKDNLVFTKNYLQYDINGLGNGSSDQRAFYEDGKAGTLDTGGGSKQKVLLSTSIIRRLTPIECCRLQTVKDDYFIKDGKSIISETQQYKTLGNGWCVDVIVHIFSYLE